MPKRTLYLLFVIALILAACQSASPTVTAPTAAKPATATRMTKTPTIPDALQQALAAAPAGCTVISPNNTPGPTEQSIYPPVTDKDWSTGPKDATITLLEYSDFQ
jgi:hypothetical protein